MVLRTPPRHALHGPANPRHPPGLAGQLAVVAAHPMAFAFVLFALAALVIGWPWLSGRVTIPWDAKAHFQPQIQFLAQSLARGDSPAWAPYVFSGHPQIADPQAMIFSPPFLALALVDGAPSLWAVDATVLAMVFLGGAALMLWFRDQGWHWAGGLIAALAFSYGASMAWRIQHIGQVLSLAYLAVALRVPGPGAGARLDPLRRCRGRRRRLHGAGARPGGAARHLSPGEPCGLAPADGGRAAHRAARKRCCRSRPAGSARALLIAVPVMLTALLARGVQPPLDRLHRRRARLAAPRAAADARHARRVRRLGPHGGLLGPAELRLARYRHLPRPEHGRALHRRPPAAAAGRRRRPRPAVGTRDPLLHLRRGRRPRSMRSAGTRRSSACSTRLCRASTSTAGRRTRRS